MRESGKDAHPPFGALLDHLAGRSDPAIAQHLAGCAECAELAASAARLLGAGRRAAAEPPPARRALRRAVRIFREERARKAPTLLELVFDSFLRPATAHAIRAGALATRFLRFAGDATVELEVKEAGRGVDVRGQLTPPDYVNEIVIVAGKTRRRTKVKADGTFVFRGVPRRVVEIHVGAARIKNLDL